jgi:hypothetical protein
MTLKTRFIVPVQNRNSLKMQLLTQKQPSFRVKVSILCPARTASLENYKIYGEKWEKVFCIN